MLIEQIIWIGSISESEIGPNFFWNCPVELYGVNCSNSDRPWSFNAISRVAVLGIYCWVWKSCSTWVPNCVSIARDRHLSQEEAWIFFSLWYAECACCACKLSRSGFSIRENSTSKAVASEICGLKWHWTKLLKCWKDMLGKGVWSVVAAWTPGRRNRPKNKKKAQEKPEK